MSSRMSRPISAFRGKIKIKDWRNVVQITWFFRFLSYVQHYCLLTASHLEVDSSKKMTMINATCTYKMLMLWWSSSSSRHRLATKLTLSTIYCCLLVVVVVTTSIRSSNLCKSGSSDIVAGGSSSSYRQPSTYCGFAIALTVSTQVVIFENYYYY